MAKGGVQGFAGNCAKGCLFIINSFVFALGGGLLGLGIWTLVKGNEYSDLYSASTVRTVGIVLCAFGSFVALLAFLGCCGAKTENRCMLLTYMFIIIILIIAQIGCGIALFVKRGSLLDSVGNMWQEALEQNDQDKINVMSEIQSRFDCCGLYSNTEYTDYNLTVPDSCCSTSNSSACSTMDTSDAYRWPDGCYDSLKDWVEESAAIVGGVLFGVAFIQILVVILVVMQTRAMKA